MHTAKRECFRVAARVGFLENPFDLDFFFPDTMRFKPMNLRPIDITIGRADQPNSLQFAPISFSKTPVETPPLTDGLATRYPLDLLNVPDQFRPGWENLLTHSSGRQQVSCRLAIKAWSALNCVFRNCRRTKVAKLAEYGFAKVGEHKDFFDWSRLDAAVFRLYVQEMKFVTASAARNNWFRLLDEAARGEVQA